MKKSYAIIFVLILILLIPCISLKQKLGANFKSSTNTKLNTGLKFKNFKYEGENNIWKVTLNQYKSNNLDIDIEYKSTEKLLGEIKFKFYLDNGYSSEGSISKTSNLKNTLARARIPVDASSKRQLKITKVTIEFNNESEEIQLKCNNM